MNFHENAKTVQLCATKMKTCWWGYENLETQLKNNKHKRQNVKIVKFTWCAPTSWKRITNRGLAENCCEQTKRIREIY